MSLLACSASVAFSPAQANRLSLGEINSSQLVHIKINYSESTLNWSNFSKWCANLGYELFSRIICIRNFKIAYFFRALLDSIYFPSMLSMVKFSKGWSRVMKDVSMVFKDASRIIHNASRVHQRITMICSSWSHQKLKMISTRKFVS